MKNASSERRWLTLCTTCRLVSTLLRKKRGGADGEKGKDRIVTRAEWLLLFLSRSPFGVVEPAALDPIRIQKGMFLLSMRGPARDIYSFRPYNWGPFSSDIYRDLDELEGSGLLRSESVSGQSWRLYETTSKGESVAQEISLHVAPQNVEWLGRVRRFVTERRFVDLLRSIYAEYPDYATKSFLLR